MPKAEWGVKRVCMSCRVRFYDLMRDPIVCPACGTELDISAPVKPKRVKPGASEKAVAKPVPAETDDLIDDEDDLDEDIDEDLDDDLEEDDEVVLDDDDDDDDGVSDVPVAKGAAGDEEDTEIDDFDGEVILEDDDDLGDDRDDDEDQDDEDEDEEKKT